MNKTFQPDDIIFTQFDDGGYVRHGGCTAGCGACCEHIIIPLDPRMMMNSRYADWSNWMRLHGIELTESDFHLLARIPITCRELDEEKRCNLFEKSERPEMCQHWPLHPMEIETVKDVCTYGFVRVAEGEPEGSALKRAVELERAAGRPLKGEVVE